MSEKEEKRSKAKRLLELAFDDGATAEERNNALVRAGRIIRKYSLLDTTPLDGILEHEGVRAAKAVADRMTDPEFVSGLKTLGGLIKGQMDRSRRRRR